MTNGSSKTMYTILIAILCISMLITSMLKTEFNGSRPIAASHLSSDVTVVIDAGHGGIDGGAVGINGTIEKNVNLDIAMKCAYIMDLLGVNIDMTRTDDRSIHDDDNATMAKKKVSDIKNRVKLINSASNPILLSIHMNSFPDSKYSGAQVFYSVNNPDGEVLAKCIQNSLKTGISDGNTREIKPSDGGIYILNNVNCPAVIVECGFLSNEKEEALLNDNNYKKKTATSICAGMAEFLYGMAA